MAGYFLPNRGGEKGIFAVPLPKLLSFREEEFWKKRFDPLVTRTITEIEIEFGLDRSCYRDAQSKLRWNLDYGFLTDQTRELLTLAKTVTKVEGDFSWEWLSLVVATRAHQVNWEKQKSRYEKRN